MEIHKVNNMSLHMVNSTSILAIFIQILRKLIQQTLSPSIPVILKANTLSLLIFDS
jgi:hypothetical protein